MGRAYYNEIDPFCAEWLRRLIAAGHIAPGDVDERSIVDVRPDDLKGYAQCHFFAGIGVWSLALRRAMWPDDRPVWTGSCPCQPFSSAGRKKKLDDERHLWPAWFDLIRERRPPVVLGEQVASKDALVWFDHVSADLEDAHYAVGAADLCAAGVGAPHIRQRLWFVALAVGDAERAGLEGHARNGGDREEPGRDDAEPGRSVTSAGRAHGLADADRRGQPTGRKAAEAVGHGHSAGAARGDDRPGPVNGFWRNADWLFCRDGKWRPVEPGLEPLVDGSPARVGRLRAYGNAIVAPVAQAFIEAVMEAV